MHVWRIAVLVQRTAGAQRCAQNGAGGGAGPSSSPPSTAHQPLCNRRILSPNRCSNHQSPFGNRCRSPREVLEWLYTVGGGGGTPPNGPPPPDQSDHSGKNEISHWENLVGPFLAHKLLGPSHPSPFLSSIHPCEAPLSSLPQAHPCSTSPCCPSRSPLQASRGADIQGTRGQTSALPRASSERGHAS